MKSPIAVFILLALAVGVISSQFLDMSADDAFITFRYSLNTLQGHGFVFNPGERVLATTAPFHAMVLIPLGRLSQASIPLAANLLSAAMLLAAAWFGYRLLEVLGSPGGGLLAALLLVLNIWTYSFFPFETIMLTALELAALFEYCRGNLGMAAVAVALAIVTRYDAVLVAVALGLHWTLSRDRVALNGRSFVLLGVSCAIVGTWLAFATIYYGSPIPNSVVAKGAVAGNSAIFLSYAWPKMLRIAFASPLISGAAIILSVGSLWLIWRDHARRYLLLLPLWGLLYVLGYTAMRVGFPHTWYYYPLIVIEILIGSYGLARLYGLVAQRLRAALANMFRVAAFLAAGGLILAQGLAVRHFSINHHTGIWTTRREAAYIKVADWLKANTPANASVAMLEIGTVGYYSERTIVDLLGLATPAATANARRDWTQNVALLRPDYVVMQNRPPTPWDTPGTQYLTLRGVANSDFPLTTEFEVGGYTIRIYTREDVRVD